MTSRSSQSGAPPRSRPRRRLLGTIAGAALMGGLALTGATASANASSAPLTAAAQTHRTPSVKPTIVLVHGAFADSSGWNAVTGRLLAAGYKVVAFSNPLRGPQADGEYLRQFLTAVDGPVVLVGHSYGGAVISNGATGNPNVKALVYVAAYAPDQGESVAAANTLGGGHTDVTDHLIVRPYPGATPGDGDASIDPAYFHSLFAQDLPRSTTGVMAATQRPGALAALVTPSGPPAWKSVPSWYLVARQDKIIPPQAERAMAKRAGATTVEIDSSHVAMMSHPDAVTKLILRAAR
ncbi:alpha/beta fold hydrolase [Planotetraspora kaengkrachanensis]|uniref:Alpha/beta hydrolase n=1 Tax=Planotetraspora kaengkrachanensis TaxID=575193 RepID=A0A8J3M249_9ACTN|nr:alpha/beta hydrolase [Planotetraspora kaengkrachanensis]GIG77680.1 alpha/beta hydrolase [Planotetraspora kaengkrachanensis]